MKSIRRMMRQVRAMFSGEPADAEMDRELAANLLLEKEMMRKGATSDEARRWRGSSWAEWSRRG